MFSQGRLVGPKVLSAYERIGIMQRNSILAISVGTWLALALSGQARAADCPNVPYQIVNGQVADAAQVMANYNALLDCINARGVVGSGTAGQLGYYGSTSSEISGESLSNILDATIGSNRGSILYRGATGWVALGPGTSGYVLQTGGPTADPTWAPPGSGGGISTIVAAGISSSASTIALPAVAVISRPALSAFTWVNQASATATEYTNGPLVLRTTQTTSGNSLNALVKTVPGTNWTVSIQYALGYHVAASNVDMAGLVVYNSVTGRFNVLGPTTSGIALWQYSSSTSWNSAPATKVITATYNTIWARAQYVAATTTLTYSYSLDGFTWETVYSTSAPYVGVPTAYGISVGTQGNSAGYALSLNYMAETAP
jgi:hypothetical protein